MNVDGDGVIRVGNISEIPFCDRLLMNPRAPKAFTARVTINRIKSDYTLCSRLSWVVYNQTPTHSPPITVAAMRFSKIDSRFTS